MCGRFILLTDLSRIVQAFDIQDIACAYMPSQNICPDQQVLAVVHDKVNRLVDFKWGLVPSWAKDPSKGFINARAETIAVKASFKDAFKQGRRCLVIADGFYEWKIDGKKKTPMQIYLKSGEPFGFAGLYEHWRSPDGQSIDSCTIITTEPNELVAPVHDRMPAILPKDARNEWIDKGNKDADRLLAILKPYPAESMAMRAIDPAYLQGG